MSQPATSQTISESYVTAVTDNFIHIADTNSLFFDNSGDVGSNIQIKGSHTSMSAGVVERIFAVADVGSLWAEAGDGNEKRRQKTKGRKQLPLHSEGLELTHKQRGEMAEAEFMAKACSLGFGVAKPWGDSDRYDFILDVAGEFWRVQVKSAHRVGVRGAYTFNLHGYSEKYTLDEIEVVVGWVAPENVWYVFPLKDLGTRTGVKVFPSPRLKKSRWEKYREAWWIFREGK